ncbi:MAG: metal ABC transporter substrate-binding protein [Fidelibacterota bacterium]
MKIKNRWSRILRGLLFPLTSFAFISVLAGKSTIQVVTTLPDLRDIAQRVGGDRVNVFAIAKGYQDPHFVDAKPSYIIKLSRADLFVQVGLDLEIGWVPSLLEGARNPAILWGARGYVDASRHIELLQVPTGDPAKLRAEGDIHIYGNPHYWLDPENGKLIANNIYEALVRVSPDDAAYFFANKERFSSEIDARLAKWEEVIKPYRGRKIVAFHNSWPYFEQRFGIDIAGFIEPKPGISPSPKHIQRTIKMMKDGNIHVIIISPYYSKKIPERIASEVGGTVVGMAPSVEGIKGVNNYFDLFDYNLQKLVDAFLAYPEDRSEDISQ